MLIQVPFCCFQMLLPPMVPGMVSKLSLCGCSHLSLFLFLRHLLRDIDIVKSEGKLQVFLICFFGRMTPLQREDQFTPPKSKNRFENVTLMQTFVRGAFSLKCKIIKNLVISLEVSSPFKTCHTSHAKSMVFHFFHWSPVIFKIHPPVFECCCARMLCGSHLVMIGSVVVVGVVIWLHQQRFK